jgi:cytoskeletal protein RodZ
MQTLRTIAAISLVNILSLSGLVVTVDYWRTAVHAEMAAEISAAAPVSISSPTTGTNAAAVAAKKPSSTFGGVASQIPSPDAVTPQNVTPPTVVETVNDPPQQPEVIQSADPATEPAPLPTDPPPDPVPTGCIISVDGVTYDVTQFRTIHGGGDIFTCGSDMSAVFWSQHNTGTLAKMGIYRVQ